MVTSGGRRLAAYRRDYLAPGEMEHITLPGQLLTQAAEAVTISIEEVSS